MFDKRVSLENWTKNHKTGFFQEVKKIKPASIMKGKAYIEVFDKEGNIEQEAVTENVINDRINREFSRNLFFSLLNTYDGARSLTGLNKFGKIILNNYTTAESASLIEFPDRNTYPTIGWADKANYAGSDLFRGDVNESESSVTIPTPTTAEIKLVFDWNTNQANGTFQSIFWTPYISTSNEIDYLMYADIASNINFTVDNDRQPVFVDKVLYYTSGLNVYSKSISLLGTNAYGNYDTTETLVKDISGDFTINSTADIAYDGTYFYIWNRSDNLVVKYDASWINQGSFALDDTTYGDEAFFYHNGFLYIYEYVGTTTWNLHKFSLAGVFQSTTNIYNASFPKSEFNPTRAFSDGVDIWIYGANSDADFWRINSSGVIQNHFYFSSTSSIYINVDYYPCYDNTSNILYTSDSVTRKYGIYLDFAPSAHTLLASPVTKTSANTMKITYTFTFDLTAL